MGNLHVNSSSRSPFTRKPIFKQQDSLGKYTPSRSVSPYLSRKPYENSSRSVINNQSFRMRNSNLSVKSGYSNRIYVNPKMIRSVIKNSSPQKKSLQPSTSRLNKSTLNTSMKHYINYDQDNEKRYEPIINRKNKYLQKTFQVSPKRQKVSKNDLSNQGNHKGQNIQQKQNIETLQEYKDNVPKLGYNHHCIMSSSSRSPLKCSKKNRYQKNIMYDTQNCNSHKHQCCCHHHNEWKANALRQQSPILDNAPTQRKNHNSVFQPFNQIQIQQFRKKRVKKEPLDQDYYHYPAPYPYPYPQQIQLLRYKKNQRNLMNSSIIHEKNREKCRQIIKRVRNFNEFLNQVKTKLRKQVELANSHNNTMDYVSFSQNQQQSFNNQSQLSNNYSIDHHSGQDFHGNSRFKSITLALRLENQKIQLEKYRKLVERELSKQHSIESIEIDSKNKDKIITINFQKKNNPKQQMITNKQVKNQKRKTMFIRQAQEQQDQGQPPPLKPIIKVNKDTSTLSHTISKLSQSHSNSQSHTNSQVVSMPQSQLQSIAHSQLHNPHQKNSSLKSTNKMSQKNKNQNQLIKRVDNIKKLFNKMQGMNKIQISTQEKIWQILKDEQNREDQN